MRMFINQIKSTTMSIRKAFKSVFSEIDELKAELSDVKSVLDEMKKIINSEQEPGDDLEEQDLLTEALTSEDYSESEDVSLVIEFAESIGLKVDKRKGIETIKNEIEEKIKESE